MHYGTGVFEGIRAYETPQGTAIFRHHDHLDRLEKSAKLYYMDLPFPKEQLREVTHELIGRNGFTSCYIRPLVYRGYGPMGLNPLENPVEAMVAVWEWGAYLGEEGKRKGVRGRVSSYRRISSDSLVPHAKACVCEGTGENIFVVKDGVINTPPQAASILDGINRRSCIQIARDLGYEVLERNLVRAELALADEVFLTGTAAELTPLREIDDIEIGDGVPGPVTREIQAAFDDALHGRSPQYADWLDLVPVPSGT